jgi:UDP-N-acetylglucosamine acyltransferase
MTAIHQFNHIGQLSMVGGFFRVTQDVPPYALAGGWPLRFEGLNVVGLRRRGFTPEQRKAIKDAYNVIYRSGLLLKDALAKIRSQPMTPEVENIVSFIENSERGIIRPTIKVEIKEDEE